MDFDHKRIVITGAASGIGQALLQQLAQYDAHILAADIDGERLLQTVTDLAKTPARLACFVVDLSGQEAVDGLFMEAVQKMGGVDIFFANAGFPYYERLGKPDWQHIDDIFRLNVIAIIYSLEKMQALNRGRDFRMVVTASAMAQIAMPAYALYSGTKAAIDRFAEGLRFELEDPRQLVMVYPIATRTNFFNAANAQRPPPVPWPSQTPRAVAKAALRGVLHNQKTVYPSFLYRIMRLLDRFLPFSRRIYQGIALRQFIRWEKQNHQE